MSKLPAALIRAINADPYDKGGADFSVTELLQPPRIRVLKARHAHEIVEDPADRLYSLYGQLVHALLERANMADLSEKRFFIDVDGVSVSGQIDTLSLADGLLSDYKFTTSWGFKTDNPPKPEWVAQLNMQAELLRQNGHEPRALQIVGLLRDWQIREAKYNQGYPQAPVVTLDIPMWTRDMVMSFIRMRISEHKLAEKSLPECSGEERWAKPDQWAVMKGKRAINGGVQFTEAAAKEVLAKNPGLSIQYRPGESVRCGSYCPVSEFCTQYHKTLNENANAKSEEESA